MSEIPQNANARSAELYRKRIEKAKELKKELSTMEEQKKNKALIEVSLEKRQSTKPYYEEIVMAVDSMLLSADKEVVVNAMLYAQDNLLNLYRENYAEVRLYKTGELNMSMLIPEETFNENNYHDELLACLSMLMTSKYVEEMTEIFFLAERYLTEIWKKQLGRCKS